MSVVSERMWSTGSSLCMATHIMLHARRPCRFEVTSEFVVPQLIQLKKEIGIYNKILFEA